MKSATRVFRALVLPSAAATLLACGSDPVPVLPSQLEAGNYSVPDGGSPQTASPCGGVADEACPGGQVCALQCDNGYAHQTCQLPINSGAAIGESCENMLCREGVCMGVPLLLSQTLCLAFCVHTADCSVGTHCTRTEVPVDCGTTLPSVQVGVCRPLS